MAKVSVFGRGLSELEIQALVDLLTQVEACEGAIEVVHTITANVPDVEDALVVLLGTPATCADSELESSLAQAVGSPWRAVWIWPEGVTNAELPPAAKKYCYSIVSWGAQKLGAVIADDDVTCFEYPNGEPLAKVETERNLCVDGEKGKKK
jgi:hypothetical protein